MTFIQDGMDNISPDDLKGAFSSEEVITLNYPHWLIPYILQEADAAFQMFDRDLNGDISCEEMELSIGKSPASSSDA